MKKRLLTFISLLFLLSPLIRSQSIDSLTNLIEITTNLEEKCSLLNLLAETKIPYGGEAEAKQSLSIAQQLGNQAYEAEAYYTLGQYYYNQDEEKPAEENLKKALVIYETLNQKEKQVHVFNLLGDNKYFQGKYAEALNYNLEAEKISKELNNQLLLGETKFFQSRIYLEGFRNDEKAFSLLEESEALLNTQPPTDRLLDVYVAFCNHFRNIGDKEGLLKYINKLENNLSFFSKDYGIYYQTLIKDFSGIYNWLDGNLDQAEILLKEALEDYKKTNDDYMIIDCQLYLAELALDQKDYPKAIRYAMKGLELEDLEVNLDSYEFLKKAYKTIDTDSFFYYDEKYQKARDSLEVFKKVNELNQIVRTSEINEKEVEVNQERWSKRIILLMGFFLSTLLGLRLLKFYRRTQKQKKQLALFKAETQNIKNIFAGKEEELVGLRDKVSTIERSLVSSQINYERQQSTLVNITQFLRKLVSSEKPENLKKQLRSLSREIEFNLNHEDRWESFAKQFEQVHPQFFSLLIEQFPNLSNRDLRLCAYVRLGMDNQEIAEILGIEASSVIKARHRMKKKMELDKEQDLNQFLLNL